MSAMYDYVAISENQVLVTSGKVQRFARVWPCSGMSGLDAGLIFSFASNGDLTDIEWFDAETAVTIAEPEVIDGSAMVALSQDARHWLIFTGNDPFVGADPCYVKHTTILSMYMYGALLPGETL
jgi:hypothetical protein